MDMFHSPSVSFAIEKIIDVITVEGNIKNFKVQWAPTWVSSLNLVGCEKLIKQFLSQRFVEYKCLDGIVKVPVDFTVEKDIPLATGRDNLINGEESIREIQASGMKKVDGITRKTLRQQEGGANIIEGGTSISISNVQRVDTKTFQDFSERKDDNPTHGHAEELTDIMEQGTLASFSSSLLQERENPSVHNAERSVETIDITTSTFDQNIELQDEISSKEENKDYVQRRKHNHTEGKALLIDNSIFNLPKVPIVDNNISFGNKQTYPNENVKIGKTNQLVSVVPTSKVLKEQISQVTSNIGMLKDLGNSNARNVPVQDCECHFDFGERGPENLKGPVNVMVTQSLFGVDTDSQQAHQEFKQGLVSTTALATLPVQVNLPNGIKSSNVDNDGYLGEENLEIDKCVKLENVENFKCNESLKGQSSQATKNDAEGRIDQRYMQNIAIETGVVESADKDFFDIVETSEVIHPINENENELAQCIRLEDQVNSFDQTMTTILDNYNDCSRAIQDMEEDATSPDVAMSVLENLSHISADSIVDSKFSIQCVKNIKSEEVASSNQCSAKSKLKLSAVTHSINPSVLRRNSLKRYSEKMVTENQILQHPKKQKRTPQKKECPLLQQKLNPTKSNSQIEASCIKNEYVFGKHKAIHSAQNNSKDTKTFELKCKRCGMSYKQKLSFDKHKCVYKCGTCLQTFCSNSGLNRHKVTHSSQRNFKCEVCSKAFKRKDILKEHMLVHENKKFQCGTCFKFYTKNCMKKHSCKTFSKMKKM